MPKMRPYTEDERRPLAYRVLGGWLVHELASYVLFLYPGEHNQRAHRYVRK